MDRDSHAALVALNRFGFGARGGALGRIPKPARGAIHATARYDDAGSLAQSGRPGCACLDPENDPEPSFLRSSMSPFLLAFLQERLDRAIEVPILPRGLPLQLRLGPGLVFEAHDRHRRQVDRRLAIDNPGCKCLSNGRRDRKPGDIAPACKIEARRSRGRAKDMMAVSGHCRNAAAKFSHLGGLQDWELILHFNSG